MRLFLESANPQHIREIQALGVIDGITTTPALFAAQGRNFEEALREICTLSDGPVTVAAVSEGWEELVEEGRALAQIARTIIVTIPSTAQGLRAIRRLNAEGVRTNATLCFSPLQALLAARVGATFVSPYVGALDDVSTDGVTLVEKTLQIYNNYNLPTQVLVSAVHHPTHVLEAAIIGADACTVPYETFVKLLEHPQTTAGVHQFIEDWTRVPKN